MFLVFSADFIESTSDIQTPITVLLVDKSTKFWVLFFLNWIVRNVLVINLSGFAEIFVFLIHSMNIPKIEFITQIKECRFRISNSLVKAAHVTFYGISSGCFTVC